MNGYLEKLMNLPRTLRFNVKVFGFKEGLKMPIFITRNIKVGKLHKGCISISGLKKRFMIELGTGGSEGVPNQRGYFCVEKNAHIHFAGKAYFAQGCVIRVDGGRLEIGSNFNANKNCTLWCNERIAIGENVLLGYQVYLRDDDGHSIMTDGVLAEKSKSIVIGNHVWCSANVSILKGVVIADDSVVGYNSCVFGQFEESNVLLGGYPAKVLKKNIQWKK